MYVILAWSSLKKQATEVSSVSINAQGEKTGQKPINANPTAQFSSRIIQHGRGGISKAPKKAQLRWRAEPRHP